MNISGLHPEKYIVTFTNFGTECTFRESLTSRGGHGQMALLAALLVVFLRQIHQSLQQVPQVHLALSDHPLSDSSFIGRIRGHGRNDFGSMPNLVYQIFTSSDGFLLPNDPIYKGVPVVLSFS